MSSPLAIPEVDKSTPIGRATGGFAMGRAHSHRIEDMRSTADLRKVWGPPCEFERRTLTMHSGATLRGLNAAVYESFQALDAVMRTFGYVPRSNSPGAWETGAYNCRKITNGSGFSLHAYGIAADINARTNPYGKRLITDMPLAMVAAIKAIRTREGHAVFRWGGDYRSNKDAMHYEVVASPREVASGIDWSTVVAQPPDQTDARTWPTLRRGDRGQAVVELNRLLAEAGFSDTNPTLFGRATVVAVRGYQSSRKLTVDGIVGLQTWTSLLNAIPARTSEEPSPFKTESRHIPSRRTLEFGSEGSEVEEMQRRLRDLEFEPGPLDGIFGRRTRAAVIAFQESNGLEADGICGKLTWRALLS